jgi:hypothetical protein
MTAATEPLFRLPVKSIATILTELCELRSRVRSGETLEIPTITLYLESGQTLQGEVIGAEDLTAIAHSTLLIRNLNTNRSLDVTYVSVAGICGLTIHHTPESIHLLSFGKVKVWSGKTLSRLELERQVRSLSQRLEQDFQVAIACTIVWGEFPTTDEIFQNLAQLLTDLQSVLLEILHDDLGKSALLQQVQRLEVNIAATPQVQLIQQGLQIQGKLDQGNLDFQPKPELRHAIMALL